ncbi:F-box/kelch-repeat protein At3g06240-like [Papaver somniferum]|uniref:F-box/kelch-repeat protein At3g06240-like n=1 Tax=Papaver somniferum TaxID=3469 RepID=UPI000E6FF5CE|nr:F-box/kelch-repeat protein At3g06240-like [Papaver somniferum]
MNVKPLMPYFPEEIIKEIHSRLPPKSLLKFRCVSKLWSVLYNNPKLIEMMQINFNIMIVYDDNMYHTDSESLSSLLDGMERIHCPDPEFEYGNNRSSSLLDGMEQIHCPDPDFEYGYSITGFVGCCNGLFCLLIHNRGGIDYCLWNPSTGDCKRIPSPPDQFDYSLHGYSAIKGYGFGYDSKSDDYKFVCITTDFNCNLSAVQIYSLKSDSWKQVKRNLNIPWLLPLRTDLQYAVFCNGALHWQTSSSSKELIALGMTDELIGGISPPENSNFDEDPDDTTRIGMLDGCLSMLYSSTTLGIEVWLMKDYGEKESWTKIYSIPKLTSLDGRVSRHLCLRRIKCLKSGEMLLEVSYQWFAPYRKALVLYDPKNETSETLMEDEDEYYSNLLSFHSYVKSSVSVWLGTMLANCHGT